MMRSYTTEHGPGRERETEHADRWTDHEGTGSTFCSLRPLATWRLLFPTLLCLIATTNSLLLRHPQIGKAHGLGWELVRTAL